MTLESNPDSGQLDELNRLLEPLGARRRITLDELRTGGWKDQSARDEVDVRKHGKPRTYAPGGKGGRPRELTPDEINMWVSALKAGLAANGWKKGKRNAMDTVIAMIKSVARGYENVNPLTIRRSCNRHWNSPARVNAAPAIDPSLLFRAEQWGKGVVAADKAKELVAEVFAAAGPARHSRVSDAFTWLTLWRVPGWRKIDYLRAQAPQLRDDRSYRMPRPEADDLAALEEIVRIITDAPGQQASYADMMRKTGKTRDEVKNLTNRLQAHGRIMRCGAGKFTLPGRGTKYVRTATIDAIEAALKASGRPMGRTEIARATGLTASQIDGAIHLHPDRVMRLRSGLYALPGAAVEYTAPLGVTHLAIVDFLRSVTQATIADIVAAVGRSRSRVYPVLDDLIRIRMVKRTNHNEYVLVSATARPKCVRSGGYVSPRKAILDMLQARPRFTHDFIATIDAPRSTIDGAILHLSRAGRIVQRRERGPWELPVN
jgi:DNA-binding IclR family transcriptional regulator